jgi:DNA-directed RNA polymerase specialized sigma24 family protein
LSKLGKWRVADVARSWQGREGLESVDINLPAPERRDPLTPSPLVQGLHQVFPQLSPRDQLILRLQLESVPMEDMGAHLGISVTAVKKAAFDARRRLRQRMEAAGFTPARMKERT